MYSKSIINRFFIKLDFYIYIFKHMEKKLKISDKINITHLGINIQDKSASFNSNENNSNSNLTLTAKSGLAHDENSYNEKITNQKLIDNLNPKIESKNNLTCLSVSVCILLNLQFIFDTNVLKLAMLKGLNT